MGRDVLPTRLFSAPFAVHTQFRARFQDFDDQPVV